MFNNNSPKFYFSSEHIAKQREREDRKNFVLITLATVMSIYAAGITLAVIF